MRWCVCKRKCKDYSVLRKRWQLQVQEKVLWVGWPHFNRNRQDRYTETNLCLLHTFLGKS